MHIAFIEVANFRKLKSVRIDLHQKTTLFVGANNSGKTSAMLALRYFLNRSDSFSINDFTLCHRAKIREIGEDWKANTALEKPEGPKLADWDTLLPMMDVWLEAENKDLHYVSHILPTLDWSGGYLGVRLRLQPTKIEELYREYTETIKNAEDARAGAKDPKDGSSVDVTLWPVDLAHFLERRLSKYFKIASYILDTDKLVEPTNGIATPQTLAPETESLAGDPFDGLIEIDEIPAQRGFGEAASDAREAAAVGKKEARKLARQFVEYFSKHLDPTDRPVAEDILALKAIETAQKAYDERLKTSFSGPLGEMEGLGYPGVTDPRITIRTRLRPVDGLSHEAAVQYEVAAMSGVASVLLPEDYNGLGYQNLISMVFRLMSFRDAWMRIGKAKTSDEDAATTIAPIHLVLIEEPEAHLHAQVQQVFIRRAYSVLRKHDNLGEKEQFTTQLVVSTHSSHVAHEVEFSCIRYFRRLPAGYPSPSEPIATVPISTVINLTDAFGDESETSRFTKRYLGSTHCDLFFADAAVFIEGAAERILLPHFVKNEFEYLNQCYITWLEVGGSHAHRLRPLIEKLGILTLIITDIDAGDPANKRRSTRPVAGKALTTNNVTLRRWQPKVDKIDELLTLSHDKKVHEFDSLFAVRVAYQEPVPINRKGQESQITPYTFEDAIVLKNLEFFAESSGNGSVGRFAKIVKIDSDAETLAQSLFEELDSCWKAEFALDLLELEAGPEKLCCPNYIADSLTWLEKTLRDNKAEVLAPVLGTAEGINTALVQVAGATSVQDGAMKARENAPEDSPTKAER